MGLSIKEHERMKTMNEFISLSQTHSEIKVKEESVDGELFYIVSYMIGNRELWKNPLSRECRGITFSSNGDIVCRPFQKFFRLNELDETDETLFKNKPFLLFDKIDGSMVTPVKINNKIVFKTKKSFYSDVALSAQQAMTKELNDFCHYCLTILNATPIFEYTSPDYRIVIDYGKQNKFTLLALRHLQTGQYLDHTPYKSDAFDTVQPLYNFSDLTQIQDHLKSVEGIEGYVLDFGEGQKIKIKSAWYDSLHHSLTELHEKSIVESILNEQIDDVKVILLQQGIDITPIEQLELTISQEIGDMQHKVETLCKQDKELTVKDFALKYAGHPLFHLLMAAFRGKDPNIIRFWKLNNLSRFSTVPFFKGLL